MTLSIFSAAREVGEHPLLVSDAETVTYDAAAAGAEGAIATLAEVGVTAEQPALVGVVGEPTRRTIELLLAAMALGAPALLLHPRAPAAARDELARTLGARQLVSPARVAGAAVHGADSARPSVAKSAPPELPDDDRPLVVVPTSGSTGAPKAVVLSRRAMVAAADASGRVLGWEEGDRWLLSLPLAHVGGLSVLTRCLLGRRTVVLAPGGDIAAIAAAVARHGVTLISLVPTQLQRLLAAEWQPPRTVRAILVGGAPASETTLAAAAARGWPVLTTYGLTEACSQVATQPPGLSPRRGGAAGLPLPGVQVQVQGGRVAVRGPTLATGYLTAADAGQAAGPLLTPLPRDPEGWFLTADLGALDEDGWLRVHGRADHAILTGGETVTPERVEAELHALPEVAEAVVVGLPDPTWGARVVAAVIFAAGSKLTLAALRERLGARLARHELPRALVPLRELPRLPNGKLDRGALLARLADETARS